MEYTARQYDRGPAAILGSLGLLLAVGALTAVPMPSAVVLRGVVIVLAGRALLVDGRSTSWRD